MSRRFAVNAVCLLLALVSISGSMAGSGCQAAPAGPPADDPRATADLKLLVSRFQGKPSGSDLAAFEVSHPNTRAAALARFLRGYLAFASADYLSAATALDRRYGCAREGYDAGRAPYT